MTTYLQPIPEDFGKPLVVFIYMHLDTEEIEVLSVADSPLCGNYPNEWTLVATLNATEWIKRNYIKCSIW